MKASNKFSLVFLILFVLSISHFFINECRGQTSQSTEKELRERIRANPNDAEAHRNLGDMLYGSKRYIDAEEEYKEAIRIDPNYAEAHNNLGGVLQDMRRYKEAEKEYKKAVKLNPTLAKPHRSLGSLFYDLGRYAEAKKEYMIARGLYEKQGSTEDVRIIDELLNDLK